MRPGEIEPRTRRWKKCVTLLDSKSPIQGLARSNQEPDDGKNASPCLTQKAPYKGLGAESEEKREPASDIDTGVVDGLKVLDPDGRLEKRTVPPGRGHRLCLFRVYLTAGAFCSENVGAI